MLTALNRIIQEVTAASDLEAALNLIVTRVADVMGVDVCSVYLTEPGSGDLVLRATLGLNADSVGQVRLGADEGLVGLVVERSEPVNLINAIDHPRFAYIVETGEERYRSFLGVPIIHYRKKMGVLVVQNAARRYFDEDEVAFLITMAAQLANAIVISEVTGGLRARDKGVNKPSVSNLVGVPGASGIGRGTAVVVYPPAALNSVPDRTVTDTAKEVLRFQKAVASVQEDIRVLSIQLIGTIPDEERFVFDAYVGMLDGGSLIDDSIEKIKDGSWAPAALRDTVAEHARLFDEMDDSYLRERSADIRDLGIRILTRLEESDVKKRRYPKDTILVGEEITASLLVEVPRDRLRGVVTSKGSATSHVSILSKALGVPAVAGVRELPIGLLDGRKMIVDGYSGRCYIDPSREITREYKRLIEEEEELSANLSELKGLPAESCDGARIKLYTNTGLVSDVNYALESGCEGIGLHRTEFPFMIRDRFPGEREQTELYRRILEPFAPRPVVMRTLDIGGDKALPYFPIVEDNPFLGWRGIRVTLDHPEIFVTQLRAMLKANIGVGNLRITLPMISALSELDDTLALLDKVCMNLEEEGEPVERPKVGVMIEVPAAVYMAEEISRRVDFLSVGTNDLTQYILAVDRNNPRVASLYDEVHPAVLRALMQVADVARRAGKPVSICGSMASDPAAAILLFAMGFDALSMSASSIVRIKWVIRTISKAQAEDLLERALLLDNAKAIRDMLNVALEELGLGGLLRAGK